MNTLVPFIIIILSLAVIIAIIVRRFPQLALLDIESAPETQEGKKKDDFLKKRVQKKAEKNKKERLVRLRPYIQKLKEIQLKFRKYVGRVEKRILKERQKDISAQAEEVKFQKQGEVRSLVQIGQKAIADARFDIAEKNFLDAVKVDAKNIDAYRGLAEVYCSQDQVDEAKQTLEFILYLDPGDDQSMMKLGDMYAEEGKIEEALSYYQQAVLINEIYASRFAKIAELLFKLEQFEAAYEAIGQAVELEPNNPKYLDKLLEISIIVGTKESALRVFDRLRLVNPENKKLKMYREKIHKMQEKEK